MMKNWLARVLSNMDSHGIVVGDVGEDVPELDQATAPASPTRLIVRIETAIGPRTIVTSSIPRRDASAIAHALEALGAGAALTNDEGGYAIKDLVKRRLRRAAQDARKAARAAAANVHVLRQKSR